MEDASRADSRRAAVLTETLPPVLRWLLHVKKTQLLFVQSMQREGEVPEDCVCVCVHKKLSLPKPHEGVSYSKTGCGSPHVKHSRAVHRNSWPHCRIA